MAYGPTSIGGYMALSPATKEDIGGVKIGDGINVAEDGTISIDVSVDIVFPVGSIYLSKNDTSPAALFGGTWVKIAENRAIMGASSSHAAGSTVEAGLPNITGSLIEANTNSAPFRGSKASLSKSGALKFTEVDTSYGGYSSYSGSQYNIEFDASSSNPIYGRSTTVQPPAYYINIWERVADDSQDLPTTGSSDEGADGGQSEDAL